MSTVTGVSLNAVFPSGLLSRNQTQEGSQPRPESPLFTAVTEPTATARNENRRELNPDERRQENQRGKPLQARAEAPEPEKELRTREQLEAARRAGELDSEQQIKLSEIQRLAERDREVRAHEESHKAIAGRFAGPISYDYVQGPDGRRYATAGKVPIDLSPAPTPEQTLAKMEQLLRAALAPAEPSSADRRIAAEATQLILDARTEVMRQQRLELAESGEAREGSRNDALDRQTGEAAEEERSAERKSRAAEDESALDERLQAINTEAGVRISRVQAAIAELLRNQGSTLDDGTLGRNVNFQV